MHTRTYTCSNDDTIMEKHWKLSRESGGHKNCIRPFLLPPIYLTTRMNTLAIYTNFTLLLWACTSSKLFKDTITILWAFTHLYVNIQCLCWCVSELLWHQWGVRNGRVLFVPCVYPSGKIPPHLHVHAGTCGRPHTKHVMPQAQLINVPNQ